MRPMTIAPSSRTAGVMTINTGVVSREVRSSSPSSPIWRSCTSSWRSAAGAQQPDAAQEDPDMADGREGQQPFDVARGEAHHRPPYGGGGAEGDQDGPQLHGMRPERASEDRPVETGHRVQPQFHHDPR